MDPDKTLGALTNPDTLTEDLFDLPDLEEPVDTTTVSEEPALDEEPDDNQDQEVEDDETTDAPETEESEPSAASQPEGRPAGNDRDEDDSETTPMPEPTAETPRNVDPAGPPLVAICGCGGSQGATTLTALLAFIASKQNRGPVLLTDLGGPSAALAATLGARATHSLGSAANAERAGVFATNGKPPFVEISGNLRLMAKEPDALDRTNGGTDDALQSLLVDAQEDHFATFIDCGRLDHDAELQVASHATHLIWVCRDTPTDVRKAQAKISTLACRGSKMTSIYLNCQTGRAPELPIQNTLGQLADTHGLSIIMAPPLGDIVEQGLTRTASRALETLKVPLERILA